LSSIHHPSTQVSSPRALGGNPAWFQLQTLVKIAPDNTVRVIWKKPPHEWIMSILDCLALRIENGRSAA
jgi:hypothetical protein